MSTQSKIKSVTAGKAWSNENGTYIPHTYELEDGTTLVANHKKEIPFNVGETIEYELKGTDKLGNNKGSVGKPKDNYGGRYKPMMQSWEESLSITRDACLGSACEFYSKLGGAGLEDIQTLANRFVAFVNHGTPTEPFEMWGDTHKRLMHRSSAVKSAVKIAESQDDCIKLAMSFIKYIG